MFRIRVSGPLVNQLKSLVANELANKSPEFVPGHGVDLGLREDELYVHLPLGLKSLMVFVLILIQLVVAVTYRFL